jgi:hypothetical protein
MLQFVAISNIDKLSPVENGAKINMNEQKEAENLLNLFKRNWLLGWEYFGQTIQDGISWQFFFEEIFFEFDRYRKDKEVNKTWKEKEKAYHALARYITYREKELQANDWNTINDVLQNYLDAKCDIALIVYEIKKKIIEKKRLEKIWDNYHNSKYFGVPQNR